MKRKHSDVVTVLWKHKPTAKHSWPTLKDYLYTHIRHTTRRNRFAKSLDIQFLLLEVITEQISGVQDFFNLPRGTVTRSDNFVLK